MKKLILLLITLIVSAPVIARDATFWFINKTGQTIYKASKLGPNRYVTKIEPDGKVATGANQEKNGNICIDFFPPGWTSTKPYYYINFSFADYRGGAGEQAATFLGIVPEQYDGLVSKAKKFIADVKAAGFTPGAPIPAEKFKSANQEIQDILDGGIQQFVMNQCVFFDRTGDQMDRFYDIIFHYDFATQKWMPYLVWKFEPPQS